MIDFIIKSLLDQDYYKFTMGQFAFLLYPNIPVKYGFTNRTIKVPLAKIIKEKELRRQLDHVRTLRFQSKELEFLRKQLKSNGERIFKEEYLTFLSTLQLPEYTLRVDGDNFILEFDGLWKEAIYWETIALSIINELYYRATVKDMEAAYAEAAKRLGVKIEILKKYPGILFSEFGTRRRFSRNLQEYVVARLAKEVPGQLLGTSNVYLAMKYGLKPIGTNAHELYMIMSGIFGETDEGLLGSHNKVLQQWFEMYGEDLSIALTDTFGSDFFFRDMTKKQAGEYRGLRHDSADPFVFGERAIKFYEDYGIDPKTKLILFSDGLDVEKIVKLYERFNGRIKIAFGWGTDLSNDTGHAPLSLVIKAIMACGRYLVKLSDNIAKAMGEKTQVVRYQRVFVYISDVFEVCRY